MVHTKLIQQQPSALFRVVVFGPESTGKTTLCKDLAAHYKTVWVPEFARDFLQNKWDTAQEVCTLEDLPIIAQGQMDLENAALKKANKVLFCDTNVLVTQIWSETHFDGYCDPKIRAAVNQVHYDLYLLTGIDIPWEADDLRDRPKDREQMFKYFKIKLKEQQFAYKHIKGGRENRVKQAITTIDSIIL
ncbi:ATP-binding protein [bacterium]|nr:ATP-binding protein [Flavobacteriaceae bacterium]MDC1279452.1 ATP-binding protein [bacterium]